MWSKLDVTIAHHPKLLAAGPVAAWLYVCGLTYAVTYHTDGFIPEAEAPHITPLDDPQAAITSLVAAGLWHRQRGGYQIHDFLDYQPSGARMKAGREAGRRRSAAYRARQTEPASRVTTGVRHTSRNGARDATVTGTEEEEEGEEESRNPAPLPPTPRVSVQPEARAQESHRLRAVPKPREVERAATEGHPLFEPLVDLFGRPPTRELTAWRDDLAALDEMGALPEDVPRAAAGYARAMGVDATGRPILITRGALVRHWHRCLDPTEPARITGDYVEPTEAGAITWMRRHGIQAQEPS